MTKLASILLLGLLLFNWTGYQLYIFIMEHNADETLIADINSNNYSEQDLISIKFPVPYLYYNANSTKFERVDGKVEIGGVQYNYVKRRLFNDSIEILCIPNKTSTQLNNSRDEFFKLVNGLQHAGNSKQSDHHADAFKSLDVKYCSDTHRLVLDVPAADLLVPHARYLWHLPAVFISPDIHPPDQRC